MFKEFDFKESEHPTTPNVPFYYDEDGTMIFIDENGEEYE